MAESIEPRLIPTADPAAPADPAATADPAAPAAAAFADGGASVTSASGGAFATIASDPAFATSASAPASVTTASGGAFATTASSGASVTIASAPASVTTASAPAFATIAMIGVVIYVIVDVVLQFLPPHYSPIRDAESDLAVGPFGWIMSINFFGRGLTCAALIIAIARSGPASRAKTVGLALFAVAGFCSALIAFFATDIARGGEATTVHGTIHVAGASTGFVFALASFWVLQFGVLRFWRPKFSSRSIASTVFLGIASVGLVFLGLTMIWFPNIFGLAERICLAGILGWVFTTGRLVRSRA